MSAEEDKTSDTLPSSEQDEGKKNGDGDGKDQKLKEPRPSFSKILGLAKPEMAMLCVAVVVMVASEASGLVSPLLLASAYDSLVNPDLSIEERMSEINGIMWIVLVIHFGGSLANFARAAIMGVAGERVVSRLRNRLYSSILRQEIAFFDEHSSGELISRLSSDTTLLQNAISKDLPEAILGFGKLVVAVALMFWISPQLAGTTMGLILVILVFCVPSGKLIGRYSKAYQDALGDAQTYSTEALGAMRTVQSFAAEDRERVRYRSKIGNPDEFRTWYPTTHKDHKTTYSTGYFKAIFQTGFFALIFGLGFGALYVTLWLGFKLVNDGEITLGGLTAFQAYIYSIGGSLGQLSRFISTLLEAYGASGRVFQLLDRIPAIPKPHGGGSDDNTDKDDGNDQETPSKMLGNIDGAVDFSNVSFNYPSRPDVPVLQDFSLSIPRNTTAALVGSSGAGKSTVVALLQRFYDVDSGSVSVDGVDIRDLDLHWFRSRIGYVQQEPQLFGMTIRENVTFGLDRPVSQEELELVCKKANVHDFVMEWPTQYDTMVGERGVRLSGGQKQRLAIARALLVDPRILILDEATSALDAESEHLVQAAIENAVVGRTVLIVAHRLSTIRQAEQIVVMDNHKIVDVGSHDDLVRHCSKYNELIKRQNVMINGSTDVVDEKKV